MLNSLTNKKIVDLTVPFVFLRVQRRGKKNPPQHLIMQLFEIRGQVLKVIKDCSHGRLACEDGAVSAEEKGEEEEEEEANNN